MRNGELLLMDEIPRGSQFVVFTGTNVEVLTQKVLAAEDSVLERLTNADAC